MAGRELYYTPTTYWDFEKSSLKNWLSETLIESKGLAFKMLRVKTGFNIEDADLPTLVDAPLEPPTDDTSENSEDRDGQKGNSVAEDTASNDEVTSFVPNQKRDKNPPKKRNKQPTHFPPVTWSSFNQRGGRYFNRQPANRAGYYFDTRGHRPSRAGQFNRGSSRGSHRGQRGQQPRRNYRPYRGQNRGGLQSRPSTTPQPPPQPPAQPPVQPPAQPVPLQVAPQTAQAPFIPWPVPMTGCQGHSQFGTTSQFLNPLLNMFLPR